MSFDPCFDKYVQTIGPHTIEHVCHTSAGHENGHLCRCGVVWTDKMKDETSHNDLRISHVDAISTATTA